MNATFSRQLGLQMAAEAAAPPKEHVSAGMPTGIQVFLIILLVAACMFCFFMACQITDPKNKEAKRQDAIDRMLEEGEMEDEEAQVVRNQRYCSAIIQAAREGRRTEAQRAEVLEADSLITGNHSTFSLTPPGLAVVRNVSVRWTRASIGVQRDNLESALPPAYVMPPTYSGRRHHEEWLPAYTLEAESNPPPPRNPA